MTPQLIYSLVVLATIIWVGIDASNLRVARGRLGGGFLDMGVAGWVFACLLLWFIAFPCYLVARSRYKALPPGGYGYGGYGGGYGPPPAQQLTYGGPVRDPRNPYAYQAAAAPFAAQPPVSPDGRFWWNGYQWLPVSGAYAAPAARTF